MLRCVNRICLQSENLKRLGNISGAVNCVVTVLETRGQTHEAINAIGARLLTRLTADTFDSIMNDCFSASTAVSPERARAFALVSNLANDWQKAQKIVENGGVRQCIDTLLLEGAGADVVALQVSAATTLERLARLNDAVVADIVSQGGLEALVQALTAAGSSTNPRLVAVVAESLCSLVQSRESLDRLVGLGGVAAVVGAVKAPEIASHKGAALQAMRLCAQVVDLDYDVAGLIEEGGLQAALNCIRAHPGDPQVLNTAMMLLSAMAGTSADITLTLAQNGGVDVALEMLQHNAERADIAKSALTLLVALVKDDPDGSVLKQLSAKNASAFIVDAMYANPDDEALEALGADVLRSIVSEDMILRALSELQQNSAALLEKRTPVQAAAVVKLLMTLKAYATCSTPFIVENDGQLIVHKLFVGLVARAKAAGVARVKKMPKKGILTRGIYRVLEVLFSRSSRSGRVQLFDSLDSKVNGLQKEVAEIQKTSKNANQSHYGGQLLRTLARVKERQTALLRMNAVEALAAILRDHSSPPSNPLTLAILDTCCRGLMELTSTDIGIKAVTQRGGTRQLLGLIDSAEHFSSEVDDTLLLSLKVLEIVCKDAAGRAIVNKQDGGTAVVACLRARAAAGGGGSGTSAEIVRACLALLSNLFDEDMVKKLVSQLVQLSHHIGGHMTAQDLANLSRLAGAIGYVARISEYSKLVVEEGGAAALVRSLIAVSAMAAADGAITEHQQGCIDAILDSLGQLGNTVPASAYAEAVPIILHRLQATRGSVSTLICVQRLARDVSNVPAIISDNADWIEEVSGADQVKSWRNTASGVVRNVPHPTDSTLICVLDRLQGDGEDATTVGAGFSLLSALCDDQQGLQAVSGSSALAVASEWLQYNLDDITSTDAVVASASEVSSAAAGSAAGGSPRKGGNKPAGAGAGAGAGDVALASDGYGDSAAAAEDQQAAVVATLELVAKLSRAAAQADQLAASGVLDLISDSVVGMVGLGQADILLGAALNVFGAVCNTDAVCASVVEKGYVAGLVALFNRNPELKAGALAPAAMLNLLARVAAADGGAHKDALRGARVEDFVMSIMGASPDSADVMSLGANILGELLTPQDLLRRAIANLKPKIEGVKGLDPSSSTIGKALSSVNSELSALMSLVYVDGAVTLPIGQDLLKLAVDVLHVMHPFSSAEAEKIKASAMQVIGKLAELDIGMSVNHCIPSIVAAATAVKSSEKAYHLSPLRSAGLGALKLLLDARDPEIVMALLRAGALRHLEKAHTSAVESGNLKAAEQVRSVLQRLAGQMLDNFDALQRAGPGFEAALAQACAALGATDAQGMVGALQFVKGRPKGDGDELLAKLLALPAKECIPEGWRHFTTEEGKSYFQKEDGSGKSVWTPPLGYVSAIDAARTRKFQNQIVDCVASLALHDPANLTTEQMQMLLCSLGARSQVADLPDDDHTVQIALNVLAPLVHSNSKFKDMVLEDDKISELLTNLIEEDDDDEVTMHAMEVFQSLAHDGNSGEGSDSSDDALAKFLQSHETVKALLHKLARHADIPLLMVAQAVTALYEFGLLLGAAGLQENGVDEAAYILLCNVVDRYETENEHVREDGLALVDILQSLYPNISRGAGQVTMDLQQCQSVTAAGSTHIAVPYKDGRVYYVNCDTKESTWDQPVEYKAMAEHFQRQAEHIEEYQGKGEEVDPNTVKACILALKKHTGDAELVANLAKTLNYLADNEANLRVIAENMGIEVIIKALKKHPGNDALLRVFLTMLEKFAGHDVFKQRIGRGGGIEVIILALRAQLEPEKVAMDLPDGWTQSVDKKGRMFYVNKELKKTQWNHPLTTNWREAVDPKGRTYYFNKKTKESSWKLPEEVRVTNELAARPSKHTTLVTQLLTMLSKLTFNSAPNTALAVKHGGIGATKACMNVLLHKVRIMELSLTNVSNWMYISDQFKEIVREQCGTEILKAIKQHHADQALFKMALRTVGNMSLLDSNVAWLSEQHAIKIIASHLNKDKNDDDTKETAIKVIGNFAKSSEDIKEEIQGEADLTVTQVIFNDGGAHAILECISEDGEENTSLLLTAIEALNDIAQDVDTAEKLLDKGLVPLVVNTMQRYDYDEEIIEPTVELISTLCYSKDAMGIFTELQGVQLLLTAMDTHEQNIDLLVNGQIALHIISSTKQYREVVKDAGGIDTVLRLMRKHTQEHEFMVEALQCLGQLAGNESICTYIAEHGMHTLMQVVSENQQNADMLDKVLKVLGFLAFQEQGVQKIVQHDGINVIMASIGRHAHQEKLMIRAIKTLDFIAMAHPDFGAIVNAHGGAAVIRKIMAAYSHVQDIQDSGKSALLFLDDPSAQAR